MKRKIPVRKHHGVRDPTKQAEQRLAKIKDKINNPPNKTDQQKIPHKLAEFIKIREDVKRGKVFKRKKFIDNEDKPKNCVRNKIKPIKQYKTENDDDYLKRVNRITHESLKEAEYEKKYGVEVVHNSKTGEITVKKKPINEIDKLLTEKRKKRGRKMKKDVVKSKIDDKTKKEMIKQVLLEEKSNKKSEEIEEYKQDTFKFGEVVHAPPTLTALPRHAKKSNTVPRPGQKDNLLLKNLIKNEPDKGEQALPKLKSVKKSITKIKSNLKGKRKDLSIAARRMIESEQTKIVELYRNLKKSKWKTSSLPIVE